MHYGAGNGVTLSAIGYTAPVNLTVSLGFVPLGRAITARHLAMFFPLIDVPAALRPFSGLLMASRTAGAFWLGGGWR